MKSKYDAVSKEHEATKDTLSKVLSQLADKSKSLSEKERKLAEAAKELEASLELAEKIFLCCPSVRNAEIMTSC